MCKSSKELRWTQGDCIRRAIRLDVLYEVDVLAGCWPNRNEQRLERFQQSCESYA
jgi:hypothetical protein